MKPSEAKPFTLADFRPFLDSLSGNADEAAVIGGMAVAAWAEMFLKPEEHEDYDLPLYSKGIDLRGVRLTCLVMAKDMQLAGAELMGVVAATRKNAPHMGKVHAAGLRWRGFRTSIEVLERLPGLDTGIEDPPNGTHLTQGGNPPLLDPCSLFICKLHAANTRPVETVNNDIMHLRILARVIPRFLEKIRVTALPEYNANEDAQRLLQQIEACESGAHDFRVPLSTEETAALISELRAHLGAAA